MISSKFDVPEKVVKDRGAWGGKVNSKELVWQQSHGESMCISQFHAGDVTAIADGASLRSPQPQHERAMICCWDGQKEWENDEPSAN